MPESKFHRFNLDEFINKYVTKRDISMFARDIAMHEKELSDAIKGRSVMVIGGAGSIGASFIRTILPYIPAKLCVVDINENALTELTRELRSQGAYVPRDYLTYPMDYDSAAFARLYRRHKGFDIVANFSAHKHVRSEKDVISIDALMRNNVINAEKLLKLLEEYPPLVYFCVSTDKAANPVNIMGASKRMMEDLIFSYSDTFPVKTARFANVAFSNGSLPSGFLQRIAKGQPISAPADVSRYFVSPQESGEICMFSALLGGNREIFFPKLSRSAMMGFDTIALELVRAYGYEPYICDSEKEAIAMAHSLGTEKESTKFPVYLGKSDTSGEKTYEEFYSAGEPLDLNRYLGLGVITDKGMPDRARVKSFITDYEDLIKRSDTEKNDVVNLLKAYLPSFEHKETGKSLDEKM